MVTWIDPLRLILETGPTGRDSTLLAYSGAR
jgi:hypothetical protein